MRLLCRFPSSHRSPGTRGHPSSRSSSSHALDIHDRYAVPDEDVHDDEIVGAIRVHVPVHEAGRHVEEVPGAHDCRVRALRAILESELTRDQEAVEFVGPMMMPARYRSALKPRPRDEGIARLERLLARDPRCRFALLQFGAVDDFDPRHGLADEGGILKALVRRRSRSARRKAPVGTLSQEGINSNPRLWGKGFLTLA